LIIAALLALFGVAAAFKNSLAVWGCPSALSPLVFCPPNLLEISKSYWSFLIGKQQDNIPILFTWILTQARTSLPLISTNATQVGYPKHNMELASAAPALSRCPNGGAAAQSSPLPCLLIKIQLPCLSDFSYLERV
jgi:hypothetical protein